jgi:hypothetical protein
MAWASSNLNHWVDMISARELHRADFTSPTRSISRIFTYWKFCRSTHTTYQWLRRLTFSLAVLAPVIISLLMWARPAEGSSSAYKKALTFSLIGNLFLWPAMYVQNIRSRVRRDLRICDISKLTLALLERRIGSNIHERILDTLRIRDATEPRDMSFGLHSLLERLPGHTELPYINDQMPLSSVYFQLTRFLLHNSKSLKVLTLAACCRCQGAPSWVPDFSWVDISDYIDDGPNKAPPRFRRHSPEAEVTTDRRWDKISLQGEADMASICTAVYGTKLPFQYHTANDEVLVVKGTSLGCITAASLYEGRSSIETTSHSGLAMDECRVGDRVVLILGVQRPLIVRNDGNHVKIVGATRFLYRRRPSCVKQIWYWILGTRDWIKYGETWLAHDKKRKSAWKNQNGWTDSSNEPHPLTYLEDFLIS